MFHISASGFGGGRVSNFPEHDPSTTGCAVSDAIQCPRALVPTSCYNTGTGVLSFDDDGTEAPNGSQYGNTIWLS
jgi:hypothetical protein